MYPQLTAVRFAQRRADLRREAEAWRVAHGASAPITAARRRRPVTQLLGCARRSRSPRRAQVGSCA